MKTFTVSYSGGFDIIPAVTAAPARIGTETPIPRHSMRVNPDDAADRLSQGDPISHFGATRLPASTVTLGKSRW